MRFARVLVPAGIALALAGTAIAASPAAHRMTVALPNGGTAIIEYRGDIAPSVRFAPSPGFAPVAFMPGAFFDLPDFTGLDRMSASLDQQIDAMVRQANLLRATPPTPGTVQPALAAFGNMRAGVNSYSSVTTVTDKGSCTRTTQWTSAGAGKPPKVVSNSSGDCSAISAKSEPGKTLNRT
ncbi:MAG: hypothetical protein NVS3B5_11880 [Sphingomicrobium sp.]